MPGFAAVSRSERVEFGTSAAKLLAFLALQEEPTERSVIAATMWPDVTDARAAANLRTVLWRVSQLDEDLIVPIGSKLGLHPEVEVDHRYHEWLARQVLTKEPLPHLMAAIETSSCSGGPTPDADDQRPSIRETIASLTGDLLTHWYDGWLELHQERWRQLRLHALDSFSIQLTEAGYHADAVDAATAAVAAEPLRESGYRSLMMAHLAEGNVSEAVHTYERYSTLLEHELGIAPSLQMYELLNTALDSGRVEAKREAKRRSKVQERRRGIDVKKSSTRLKMWK